MHFDLHDLKKNWRFIFHCWKGYRLTFTISNCTSEVYLPRYTKWTATEWAIVKLMTSAIYLCMDFRTPKVTITTHGHLFCLCLLHEWLLTFISIRIKFRILVYSQWHMAAKAGSQSCLLSGYGISRHAGCRFILLLFLLIVRRYSFYGPVILIINFSVDARIARIRHI